MRHVNPEYVFMKPYFCRLQINFLMRPVNCITLSLASLQPVLVGFKSKSIFYQYFMMEQYVVLALNIYIWAPVTIKL